MENFWIGLGRPARVGVVIGILVIASLTAAAAAWLLRTDYEPLFGGLSTQDAAAMTAELDRMKVPYALGADGTAILVDKATVHATRLKLMGKDLPLHGAVGFELFNGSDFGMTEFAQKVNYQRALQGEITRTILSLSEVETARVHLALPEDGLFKRERGRGKASIALALRQGRSLRHDQVAGIQKLVAASVPGISTQDVTLVNQHGVALTQGDPGTGSEAAMPTSASRLDLKLEVEQQLAAKANAILEKTFGAGNAFASVDATLDMNLVRTTTEDVTAPTPAAGAAPAGVIVRERESVRGDAAVPGSDAPSAATGDSIREVEYQVGRRVEQVVSSPGSIKRLHVLAIVKAPLSTLQAESLRALLAASVGSTRERGDTVVVQSVTGLIPPGPLPEPRELEAVPAPAIATPHAPSPQQPEGVDLRLAAGCAAAALVAGVWSILRSRRRRAAVAPVGILNDAQRQLMLEQVRAWIDDGATRPDHSASGRMK